MLAFIVFPVVGLDAIFLVGFFPLVVVVVGRRVLVVPPTCTVTVGLLVLPVVAVGVLAGGSTGGVGLPIGALVVATCKLFPDRFK